MPFFQVKARLTMYSKRLIANYYKRLIAVIVTTGWPVVISRGAILVYMGNIGFQ